MKCQSVDAYNFIQSFEAILLINNRFGANLMVLLELSTDYQIILFYYHLIITAVPINSSTNRSFSSETLITFDNYLLFFKKV